MVNLALLAFTMLTTVFVVLGIGLVAIGTNSAQSNQNAADAAALAGAEAFERAGKIYFAPGFSSGSELRGKVRVSGACPAMVRAEAGNYAQRNGSDLASCRMLKWGEVEVTTRRPVPVDGADDGLKKSRAHWQIDLDDCVIDPTFVAPITGAGYTWMQCGDDRFDLKYAAGRFFLHPWGQVKQAIEPRITE